MATVGVLVLLAIATWAMTRSALLDLDHVRVVGVNGAAANEVGRVVELETGTAMFELDLGTASRTVTDLPWVRIADAKRDWPGTVVITVEPRVAVAVIGAGSDQFLVDDEGVLFATAGSASTLPIIDSSVSAELGEVESSALAALPVAQAITDDLLPWIDSIVVLSETDSAGRPLLELALIGGVRAELGTAVLIEDQVEALRSVLHSIELACITSIDLIVPDLNTLLRELECRSNTDDAVE